MNEKRGNQSLTEEQVERKREKTRQRQREYYRKNRDKILAQKRQKREEASNVRTHFEENSLERRDIDQYQSNNQSSFQNQGADILNVDELEDIGSFVD